MALWDQVDLSQWDGKAGAAPTAVKKDFTYADLATGDDEMRAKAIDRLKAHAKDQNPFFMYLCFLKVHNPNNPSPRWKGKSPGGGNYLDALMELDDNSGQVVQAIRDLGIDQNTLVVWTTDNGAWIDAWPDAGYTPFRGMKGSSFEGGFRVPAIAWWPGHIKPGTVNMDMWSHMDWWPTFAKLAGLEPPPHDWKDNDGNPIIFDGIDLSESLLGTRPGKRDNFIYFNDQSFGGVRVKNFKALYTAKDTLARTGAIPKDPGALRSLVGPRRELRHRFQRCGADPGRLQDLARPLFRPGQWLDRPLHQPRDDAVLG